MTPEDVAKHLGYAPYETAPAWVKQLAILTSDSIRHAEELRRVSPHSFAATPTEDWLAMAKKHHELVLLKDGWTRTQKAILRRMDDCLTRNEDTVVALDGTLWVTAKTLTPTKSTEAAASELVRMGVWARAEWRTSVFAGQRLVTTVYRPLRSIYIEDKRKPRQRRD